MDCLAQTEPLLTKEPPDKLKKFIKIKQKIKSNGIENDGFQDEYNDLPNNISNKLKTSNSLEELTSDKKEIIKEENLNGVKKKSITGLTRSESTNISGAKRKIRPTSKSPNKEYYQLWASTSCSKSKDKSEESNSYNDYDIDDDNAPPLPPRTLHKPLKRSHALNSTITPPVVHRQHKPKMQKPEDTFGFELIDIDESKKLSAPNANVLKNTFITNEFNSTSTPIHQSKSPINDSVKKLIGSDNYITTVFKAATANNSSPTKERDLLFNDIEAKSNSPLSVCNSSTLENSDIATNSEVQAVKPHKPLCRQLSNKKNPNKECELKTPLQEKKSSSSTDTNSEEACGITESKTPLHNFSKTNENKDILRPHPRSLTRITGTSSNIMPVCPPTPTHHSRRLKKPELRPPSLKAADSELDASEAQSDASHSTDTVDGWLPNGEVDNVAESRNLHPILTKSDISFNPRLSLRALTELHVDEMSSNGCNQDERLELRLPDSSIEEGEASGGIPLPLRHLRSTRLPSIPERSHRVLAITELPGDHEEPLPPCMFF